MDENQDKNQDKNLKTKSNLVKEEDNGSLNPKISKDVVVPVMIPAATPTSGSEICLDPSSKKVPYEPPAVKPLGEMVKISATTVSNGAT